MKSWSQTWLNEGFATYVSHLGGDILTPDLNSWGRFVAHRNVEMVTFCFFSFRLFIVREHLFFCNRSTKIDFLRSQIYHSFSNCFARFLVSTPSFTKKKSFVKKTISISSIYIECWLLCRKMRTRS